MRTGFAMILACAMALSCGGPGGNPQREDQASAEGPGNIDPAMSEWIAYLESSDEGLWEQTGIHTPVYAFTGFLTDPEALDPLVYNPYDICTSGDTVLVTDFTTKQIVALYSDGNLLWKAGREGEGPGEFPMVSTIAVSPRYVAASNYYLSRIEFFNRDGSYSHGLSFSGAQGMTALDDSTFIVTSTTEGGGDIHLVSPENGVLESFGEVETIDYGDVQRMDLIRICTNGDGRLALFNRYEGLLAIYDLGTRECVYRGSRTYPATPSPPQSHTDSDGNTYWLFLPVGGDAFMGHDGMLNVIITGFMEDGSFLSDPENVDFAPYTSIDRYDWDGNYLDSYCLPDSCISHVSVLPGERFVARDFSEGVLRMYDRH